MKKRILLPTILTCAFAASVAHAQVDIYVTGSTAFRANAYRSVRAMYGANLVSQNPADPASSANQVTWSGTMPGLFGAQTVTVRAGYSGSISGIQSLAQNLPVTFLTSATPGDTNTVSSLADFAFSDVFQSSSPYRTPTLTDSRVGVVVFAYVKSLTTSATVSNVTIQQMKTFLPNGILPVSYFTGNTADSGDLIYLVGRDTGSGTRKTAEKDAGFNGTATLWKPDGTCTWNIDAAGFSSGSGIVGVLNGACGPAIGYLGLPDAANVNGGNNILTYDGVMPFNGSISAPDFSPVREGKYSFWGYEHLFNLSTLSATKVTFRNAFGTEINNDLATSTSAVQTTTMHVTRNADGGPISP